MTALLKAEYFKNRRRYIFLTELALTAAATAVWLVDRRADPQGPRERNWTRIGLGTVSVVVAVTSLVWVYLVGDSGARSVWSDQMTSAVNS